MGANEIKLMLDRA